MTTPHQPDRTSPPAASASGAPGAAWDSSRPAACPAGVAAEALPQGVALLARDGTVLYANRAFRLLVPQAAGPVGSTWLPGMPDLSSSSFLARLAEAPWEAWLDIGEDRWLRAVLSQPDQGLDSPASVLTLEDVTDRVRTDRRFVQEERREHLARIAGGIAHDFNNLLWTIAGSAEIALDEVPEGSAVSEDISLILKAAQLGKHLVDQIHSLSGSVASASDPVDLGGVVQEAVELMRATLPPTLEVRREISVPEPVVAGNHSQLVQMVVNLCRNASQAMRARRGVLSISVSEERLDEAGAARLGLGPGSWLRLAVSDNGRGMSPELVRRVFEPFFSMKASGHGVGIGLTVVRQVARNHGGAVHVDSEPGRGSTFVVHLPSAGGGERGKTGRAGERVSRPGRGERVLVAAPPEDQLRVLARSIEHLGFRPVAFGTAEEAFAAFKEARRTARTFAFAVIDSDIGMGQGPDLAHALMSVQTDGTGLPVVLLVADDQPEAGTWTGKVLRKPLASGSLAAVLGEMGREIDRNAERE